MKIIKEVKQTTLSNWQKEINCSCGSIIEIDINDVTLIGDTYLPIFLKYYVRFICPICNEKINIKDCEAYEFLIKKVNRVKQSLVLPLL